MAGGIGCAGVEEVGLGFAEECERGRDGAAFVGGWVWVVTIVNCSRCIRIQIL